MTAASWHSCLDAFERHVREQHAALEQGRPQDVEPFRAPAGLGPLPRELRPRAAHLSGQARGLEEAVSAALGAAARQLGALAVLHPASLERRASFVDVRS